MNWCLPVTKGFIYTNIYCRKQPIQTEDYKPISNSYKPMIAFKAISTKKIRRLHTHSL